MVVWDDPPSWGISHRHPTESLQDTASKRLKDPEIARIEDNVPRLGEGCFFSDGYEKTAAFFFLQKRPYENKIKYMMYI